jgi:hypothetical protein
MFARMNKIGASLGPAEIEFKPADYSGIVVTGFKETELSPSTESVPDWVTSSSVTPVEGIKHSSELDTLAEYAKTVKPTDTSISIDEDKSNIMEQADDYILKYGSTIKPEKRVVGATRVDDEYKGGMVNLVVRSDKKKLDELDKVFNLHSRSPGERINLKGVDGKLSISIDGKSKIIDIPISDPIYYNNLRYSTVEKIYDGFRLNEHDLSVEEIKRVKELFGDAI